MSDANADLRALPFDAHHEPLWLVACRAGDDLSGGPIVAANAAAVRRYGWSSDEFGRLRLGDLDTAPPATAGGATGRWHRTRWGHRFEVELTSQPVERDGRPMRLVRALDLTARRAAEPGGTPWQAQAAEARLRLYGTLERVSDGIALFDADRRYRYLNDRLAHLLGVEDPSELIGQHIWERFPERVGSPFHEAFERSLRTRQPVAVDDLHAPAGRWLDSRLHPTPDGGLAVFATDVTEQRVADRAVREAREQWRLLAEQVPAIIYRADAVPPRLPRWISPRLADLGYRVQDWLDDPGAFRRAIHPDDVGPVTTLVTRSLDTRGEVDVEFRLRDAWGRWRHIRDIARIVDGGEQGPCLQGVMFDITADRESADALRQSRQALADLARRLMDQEKATTRRVAQALHDRLGQTLAVSRLHVDALAASLPAGTDPALRDAARHVSELLSQAVAQVREVLVDLRPPLLDDHGLVAALGHEVRTVQRAPGGDIVRLDLGVPSSARWPAEVEHAAFMVVREAVTNALRHAAAHEVRVGLAGDDGGRRLAVDIDDDGLGIDPALAEGRIGHLGITGMRERATAVGAMLSLQRRPEGGTRVAFRWATAPDGREADEPAAADPAA